MTTSVTRLETSAVSRDNENAMAGDAQRNRSGRFPATPRVRPGARGRGSACVSRGGEHTLRVGAAL
ncbi:MAG TPA: hypothetical protein VI485_07425 [Vicinamibacterales bacterium]|nr:hypothetical protein [Vicinamibacterales bacterium]